MSDDFTGVTPDGHHLAFRGQTRAIPERTFARPAPIAISEADPFYLPDVPASEWAWDAQANEWTPDPKVLAGLGMSPPSHMTVFLMKVARRAHLIAKDEIFRRHPVEAWGVFLELSYLDIHVVLRLLEERRMPREIVDGHVSIGAVLLAIESQCWSGGKTGAPQPDSISTFEAAISHRHAQYRRLKFHADPAKSNLSSAAGKVLDAAFAGKLEPEDRRAISIMMEIVCHQEIQTVQSEASQVPVGFWGPQPTRPGGQQFSEDGLYYWDGEAWLMTCRSWDQSSFWDGEDWRARLGAAAPVTDKPAGQLEDDPIARCASALLVHSTSILFSLENPPVPEDAGQAADYAAIDPPLSLTNSDEFEVVSEIIFYNFNLLQRLLMRDLSEAQGREAIPALCFAVFDRLLDVAAPALRESQDFQSVQATWINRNYERNEFYSTCRIGADDKGSMAGDLNWEASKFIVAAAGAGSWKQVMMPMTLGIYFDDLLHISNDFVAAYVRGPATTS